MAPSGYIQSRQLASQSPNIHFTTLVNNRPYLPNLTVDATNEDSIRLAALTVVLLNAANNDDATHRDEAYRILSTEDIDFNVLNEVACNLTCKKVTGGITNALYRVSGFQALKSATTIQQFVDSIHRAATNDSNSKSDATKLLTFDSILIRIFGAEGMINRDIETSTYAALCYADIAHDYLGRFSNGRLEGWLDGYTALRCDDLQCDVTSGQIAREMARLHCSFEVPEGELRDHHGDEVGLWDQLQSWTDQALGYSEFKTEDDTNRIKELELTKIAREVRDIIDSYTKQSTNGADIAFCHNDMLAANIMRDPATNSIQLIDFEYGGTNYKAFDIANHLNEHAGGTTAKENGIPDYDKFPKEERQKMFCLEYVRKVKEIERQKSGVEEQDSHHDEHKEAMSLLNQVKEFVLINHLYWGLWAVNQAAEEGCEEFDYITYATNRFKQFYKQKAEWVSEE